MINMETEEIQEKLAPTFPWIGILESFGTVVLFTEIVISDELYGTPRARGIVIKDTKPETNGAPLGNIRDSWAYLNFEPYNDAVECTFRNKEPYREYNAIERKQHHIDSACI